jgi:hypothetical protein
MKAAGTDHPAWYIQYAIGIICPLILGGVVIEVVYIMVFKV